MTLREIGTSLTKDTPYSGVTIQLFTVPGNGIVRAKLVEGNFEIANSVYSLFWMDYKEIHITFYKDAFVKYFRKPILSDKMKQHLLVIWKDWLGYGEDTLPELGTVFSELVLSLKPYVPETIVPEDVLLARNVTIQKELLEKIGYKNFLEGLVNEGYSVVLRDCAMPSLARTSLLRSEYPNVNKDFYRVAQKQDGVLWQIDNINLLQVKDTSTGAIYLLRVPPDVDTVRAAKAWTFDMDEEDYNPVKEA